MMLKETIYCKEMILRARHICEGDLRYELVNVMQIISRLELSRGIQRMIAF
jgi:hypothetical protein